MTLWVKVETDMPRHLKTIQLARALGIDRVTALGWMMTLLCWVQEQRPDGDLDGMCEQDIADAVGYENDASEFVKALVCCRFLDLADDSSPHYLIHGWSERYAKMERAKEAARDRQNKRRKRDTSVTHAAVTVESQQSHGGRLETGEKREEYRSPNGELVDLRPSPQTARPVEWGVDIWNEMARTTPGMSAVTSISAERKRKWKIRAGEPGFVDAWPAAVRNLGESEFAREGRWASFDWLVKNGTNWVKASEGQYNGPDKSPQPAGGTVQDFQTQERAKTVRKLKTLYRTASDATERDEIEAKLREMGEEP